MATIGRNRSRIAVGAVVVVLALAFAVSAGADTATDVNWAGYTVTGGSVSYTSVTATWRAPVVTCAAADAGNQSAFWVGLGGLAANLRSSRPGRRPTATRRQESRRTTRGTNFCRSRP